MNKLIKLTLWAAAVLLAGGLAYSQVYATRPPQEHVNICHHTGSDSHPGEAIQVDVSAFDGQGENDHTKHGDFLYQGDLKDSGKPAKNGEAWCDANQPPVEEEQPPVDDGGNDDQTPPDDKPPVILPTVTAPHDPHADEPLTELKGK